MPLTSRSRGDRTCLPPTVGLLTGGFRRGLGAGLPSISLGCAFLGTDSE